MKLAFFNDYVLGVVKEEMVFDASAVVHDLSNLRGRDVLRAQDIMVALIERFDAYRDQLHEVTKGKGIPVGRVRFRPPLPRPGNIVCMAVNYMEDGTRKERPAINAFQKAPAGVIGDGDVMQLPDVAATTFEGEAELAAVIGRRAAGIKASEAMGHIFGFLNLVDGSARGVTAFYAMKARDTFCAIGPYIVTADGVPDPGHLRVRSWNGGTLMQDYNTGDMAHDIAHSLEWVTSIHTLEPGDIVAFGTNHRGLNPFQDGDMTEMEVDGLGRLRVGVQDALKRTWPRETRSQRADRGETGPSPQSGGKYATAIPPESVTNRRQP